jgi:hypothetical protein
VIPSTTFNASPNSPSKWNGLERRLQSGHFTIIVAITSTVLITMVAWGNRGFVFDDPGIFWRYAEHLATGVGWDYNAGQPGTANAITSPLYVLLLTLFRVLAGPGSLPTITSVLFVVFLSGTATVTFIGLRLMNHAVAGLISALLVCTSPLLFMTRGMESSLYLFLVVITLLLFITDHKWSCGIALGLLILTRPDGALLAIAISVFAFVRFRKVLVAQALSASAVVLPWLVYSRLTFGQIYPSTLATKIAQGHSGLISPPFVAGLVRIPGADGRYWSVLLILPIVAGVIALVRQRNVDHWVTPLLIYTTAYVIAYILLWVPYYEWYYALPTYFVIVVAALGLESIVGKGHGARMILGCLIVCASVLVGFYEIPTGLPAPRSSYQSVGYWIKGHTQPDATIASIEIGLIGYYSQRPMVDFLGLLSATDINAIRHGNVVSWVKKYEPDYIVVSEPSKRNRLEVFANQPWFNKVFHPVHRIGGLVVFKRFGRVP